MKNDFGAAIRLRRQQLGMTLAQVAKRVRVSSRSCVSNWETGFYSPPSPPVTRRLARTLNFKAEYLLALAHAVKAPIEVRHYFVAAANKLSPPPVGVETLAEAK